MWSKLPSDLIQLIFERLGFADFQRAKSVCLSWRYASKQSSPNNQIPWLILFPEKARFLVYSRKGDKYWKRIELFNFNFDMVYKDHRLYLYTSSRDVKVLDFSQGIPRQVFETQVNYDYSRKPEDVFYYDAPLHVCRKIKTENLVVRVTGEVLRVKSIVLCNSDVWYFRIYKMNSSNSEWEKLDSLGDEEAIFLDLGITVTLANTIKGVNGNSIYFSGNHNNYCDSDLGHFWSKNDILIFNLGTQEIERPHPSIFSSIQLSNARWFVPNFKQM
ncbi:hypothetical protein YC2023_026796 [Brassica napus]